MENMNENCMNIGEFSKLSGIKVKTLQAWDANGKLKAYRTATGRRYYTINQLKEITGVPIEESHVVDQIEEAVIYTRSYGPYQVKFAKSQAKICNKYAQRKGIRITNIYNDYTPGSTLVRPGLLRLLEDCKAGYVKCIIIQNFSVLATCGIEGILEIIQNIFKVRVYFITKLVSSDTLHVLEDAYRSIFSLAPYYESVELLLNCIEGMQMDYTEVLPDDVKDRYKQWIRKSHNELRQAAFDKHYALNKHMMGAIVDRHEFDDSVIYLSDELNEPFKSNPELY